MKYSTKRTVAAIVGGTAGILAGYSVGVVMSPFLNLIQHPAAKVAYVGGAMAIGGYVSSKVGDKFEEIICGD